MARKKSPSALDDRLQRELWALALLALAVLLALAFIPPWWMGSFGTRLFPTGNIVGVVGAVIAAAAWVLFGISGYLLPAFPAVWATHVLGRVDRGVAWRATGLLAGLCLLVPTAIYAFTLPSGRERPSAGWVGEALAGGVWRGVGAVGRGSHFCPPLRRRPGPRAGCSHASFAGWCRAWWQAPRVLR